MSVYEVNNLISIGKKLIRSIDIDSFGTTNGSRIQFLDLMILDKIIIVAHNSSANSMLIPKKRGQALAGEMVEKVLILFCFRQVFQTREVLVSGGF
jgi:hypothetical protein